MKLKKKTETEILNIYDIWLQSYLSGDVKTYDSFLDDDYHFIGSAAKEEFLNRHDTTQFFADTGEQFAGKTEIRNESKTIEQFGELIFITHVLDGWFLNEEEWNFYSRFRFTSVLRKNEDGWRFIYQHFSIPDPKTAEGETIGYDKINEENQELREAIQRRTYELEEKNRELEVEGALERIRAQAVAMKASDDLLDIVVTLRNEFIKLGHEAQYFWHMMWGPETYEKAMTSGDGSRIGFVMTLPRHIHGDIPLLAKWEKSKKPTVVYAMNVEEAIDYIDKMVNLGDFKSIDPRAPSHDNIRHIGGLTFIMARTTHGEIGYSLPGVVKNPPQQDLDILVQFASAFDLAHQRFLDLQKAEQQAREVEIELALEKVRSRSMAMSKSDELKDVIQVVYDQLVQLQVNAEHTGFIIDYKDNEDMHIWLADHNAVFPKIVLPYFDCAHWNSFNEAKKKGQNFFANQLGLEEKNKFYKDLFQFIPDLPEDTKKTYFGFDGLAISTVLLDSVGLYIENYSGTPFSEDENAIIMRVGKVFQQAYTRFLDLQKAEAQAREAQIEASLERLRSRTMAMHSTNELQDVIHTVHQELIKLEIGIHGGSFIAINHEIDKELQFWGSGGTAVTAQKFIMPYYDKPFYTDILKGIKSGPGFFTESFSAKEKKDFFTFLFQHRPWSQLDKKEKEEVLSTPSGYVRSCCVSEHTSMVIINHFGRVFTENENLILKRFARVFEQTYTRFLDLQKAEAQAREAQIETALEKVRGRSMAMHQSDEIGDVAFVLFQQLKNLGGDLWGTGFGFCENGSDDDEFWFANEKGIMPNLKIPHTKDPVHKQMYHGWKNNLELFSIAKDGNELKDHYKYMLSVPAVQPIFQGMLDSGMSFPKWQKWHAAYFKYGYLLVITTEPYENEAVFKRFANVFEQAYTRFLDLKKAEAQTREAQINLAVERVRAKALAMHKSEEIMEVVAKLKEEVMGLDIEGVVAATIFLKAENNQIRMWDLSALERTEKGYLAISDITFKLKKKDPHLYIKRVWENPKNYCIVIQDPKDLDRIIEFMYENNQLEVAKEVEDYTKSTHLKELYHATQKLNNGKLCIDMLTSPPDEMETILNKMGTAFDLAYKRFEDIKKAELQAREAQIEASLERVRAKAMSMQNSDELDEVLSVLCEQFDVLGIVPMSTHMTVLDFKNNTFTFRETGKFGNRSFGEQTVALDAMDNWKETVDKWKADKATSINKLHFPKEQLPEVWDVFHESFASMPEGSRITPNDYPDGIYHTAGKHPFGYIGMNQIRPATKEEEQIVIKFANEFGRAYQRFLDLQKAEAQAREAQIEAALERIRSRTMGMQSSEELPKVANLLFNEVQGLGIPAWSCGYNILAEDQRSATCCMSSQGTLQTPFQLRLWGEASFEQMGDFIQSDQNMLVQELGGSALEEHYAYMKSFSDLKPTFDEIDRLGLSLPNYQINHLCKFNQGFILFITYEKVPHAHDIFKRFTKVFDQTYTRFLDLKKAEAQARESQIEAALERVRSHSMGMQSTDDFGAVTTEMFNQLRMFGEDLFATGIVFCNKHEGHVEQWHSIPGAGMVSPFIVPIDLDYIHQYRYDQWKKGEELFSIEIPSDFIEQHFQNIFNLPSAQIALKDLESRNAPMPEAPPWEIDYGASFEHGYVLISSLKPLENTDILLRFTKVFEQAYTRFLDLKKAEAQAREAKIETALEKVRSHSLSMQQPNELNEVVQLIAEKLQELDVILDLGGVVICTYFPDSKDVLHWIATPDSESSGKFLLPYFDHIILKEAWASKSKGDEWFSKAYSIEEKNSFFKHAFKHSDYKHFPEEAKKDILNRKHHTLSFAWSKHSALLIPSYSGLMPTDDEKEILIRFAKVFEHAYIRFMDLQEKEVQAKALFQEKKRLEETLSDLQTTQKQLIQSEKMASLGELTAGIAHEIQNPLNFVNNFSEVSKELLEEMQEEIDNGDFEEVKVIMQDVIHNLEKINHHGQRADGIVKGMLQHSRSGSDQKEATDLNVLADEYLRLAYHGLRAKDKSFNAELVTDFDNTIKPVKVMPQDIGRVILNLLTNAFYIVHQKKQTADKTYKPTVIMSTKSHKQHIEIKVIDNGNGIPDHIKDKIFQPFFTTKPTGEGTGLGLSLSYDIITKGHGGKLEVNTKTKQGTEFTIQLPS